MADANVTLRVTIGGSPAVERLRRFLPGALRIARRQHRCEIWDALVAAEEALAELDAAREDWRRVAMGD